MACSCSNILEYMDNRQWASDAKIARKRYMCRLARDSKNDPDIASKIGGMLIYNQVIEQWLQDIVRLSILYIKAQIWPVTVSMEVDIEKATFGKVIEYFTQYATVEENRELILSHLKKFNAKRNQVVHDLFDVEDLQALGEELNKYAELADEIICLLADYEQQVCENFSILEKQMHCKNPGSE